MHKIFKIQLILIIMSVCLALTMTGCDEVGKLISMVTGHSPGGPGRPGGPGGPPQVSVIMVDAQKVVLTTELPGRTAPFRIAQIRPQVSGLVLKRLFEEGSDVKAGQVLYQIDPAPFQSALDSAKAALGRAEANLKATRLRAERYKDLLADKAVSQQNYDDAVAALTQVEADIAYWKATVKTARINLGYTQITAPISGRIGRSSVTDGAIVTAYQPMSLATIQQLDPIYIDVPQSTTELLRLKSSSLNRKGSEENKVTLMLEDLTVYPHEGILQFSDVTVDPTTGSVILRAVVPNPDGVLLPGMFVRAKMIEGVNEQAILVPQQGVTRDPKGNPLALVIEPGDKVGQRMLTIDRAIGDKWLVNSGLVPGDRVIIEGLGKVRPGMSVKVLPSVPGPPTDTAKSDDANQQPDHPTDGGK
jgi:membrane fusion protein, multidrug efflux system